jgi:hypothetical protein
MLILRVPVLFSVTSLTVASALLLSGVERADANSRKPNTGNAARQAKQVEKLIDGKIIDELHQIEAELKRVNHDYDGHRLKALSDIATAIRELSPHRRGGTTAAPKKDAKQDPKKESESAKDEKEKEKQAASDAQVRQVIGQLMGVEKQLHDFREHKGYNALAKAIVELEAGLKNTGDKKGTSESTATKKPQK